FVDERTETEVAFKKLLVKLNQANFDRLGFEAKAGETDEDELVRQIVVANMIAADDEKASQKASQIFEAYHDTLEKLPAATRL
ncbi:hypothetical protein QP516_12130, partial [Micrococcus luteus]|nr:hypothetical protein [Micrococcus luteus]